MTTSGGNKKVNKSLFNILKQPVSVCSEYEGGVLNKLYSYDRAGRLIHERHCVVGKDTVDLLYGYDKLGRLKRLERIHGKDSVISENAYNIRSWLTGIDSNAGFVEQLHYVDGLGDPCYNGNISSMTWEADGVKRGYKFMYDGRSRLLRAVYGEGEGLNVNQDRFNEEITGYDKNGNILGIKRCGKRSEDEDGLIDNLVMSYNGNQLKAVSDSVTGSAHADNFEFKDGADLPVEYYYDSNGNLIQDLNKKISEIQYNCLNLPSRIEFEDGGVISYLYDAKGIKFRTTHIIAGKTTTTDYFDDAIYENGVLTTLLTELGYISLVDGKYHYYLKDHQGNNRVVINQSGTVEETNHYYPFGGVFGTTGNTQPYKYNGKELDTKQGLNWYDYGARHYDAALGRFTTNDPLAEKYYSMSPYTYCADNPVKFIDPNGMEYAPGDLFKTKRAAAKDWGMYYNGASIIRKREMGSSIYEVKQKGKLKGYSYSAANEGEHSVSISLPPNGERFVGSIHSHGDADAEHINNKFSKADIKYIEKTKENGYLATPSGDLLEYNPYSKKTSIVTSDLPSDPKDPKRKNNINPKDIPAEKGKQRMKELLQKPDLNIPVSQREHIHWVF